MKLNINKLQEGGNLAPWVGYSPFFQLINNNSNEANATASARTGDTKIDNSQKKIKDIIGEIVGKGLTNEVNYFAQQVGELFSDNDLLGQPMSVRQYTSIVSKLNEIQNNKKIFDDAKSHAIDKGTWSEAAIDFSGNLFAQNKDGELVIINPAQYANDKQNYRLLTNSDLLTLRNNSNSYMFDNSLSQTVAGSINIQDINENIQKVVAAIGTEKESSDYFFDKAKANKLQEGLRGIIQEKLNTAPDSTYKVTEEISTERANIDLALNYIWNNLDSRSKNTLIARASVNQDGNPIENAVESIKNILVFGTDYSHKQTIKEEKVTGKGDGSGSGGTTKINPLMSYVSDPKNQNYTIKLGNDYQLEAKASVRPLIGADGNVLNDTYLSDAITSGGLGALVDVIGASVGTGKPMHPADLNKILYQGDKVAMTWLPFKYDDSGSKIVDLESLERIEQANKEIAGLNNPTEDQKNAIYNKYDILHLVVKGNKPLAQQLQNVHQFMVIPSLVPETVAEELGLDKIMSRLSTDEEKKAREVYERVKANTINTAKRKQSYIPETRWLGFNDDIYKASVFLPVQDELISTLFTGKTEPLVSKGQLDYENIISNQNEITQPEQGLNPEAFK